METVYQHTQGFQQYSVPLQQAFLQQGICITYGELLYPSVKEMTKRFRINSKTCFLDLGSGLGKCSLQIFMQTDLNRVVGIEASSVLHQQALQVKQQMYRTLGLFWDEGRELTFIQDNFLQADWQGANIIYSCSTCFTMELLTAIGDKINTQPQVQQVFSLRPLPTLQLPLREVFGVECSWDSALCFYYG